MRQYPRFNPQTRPVIPVPCAEYADFEIASSAGSKARDAAPFLDFAARRPASALAREAYRASRGSKIGEEVYKKYKVQGTPFILFLDGNGNEVDWIYTYAPPASKFHEKVMKVLKGEDTFRALSAKLASDRTNVPLLMQVARKHESRFETDKALPLYKEILALDPEGKAGTTAFDGGPVPCVEYAGVCRFRKRRSSRSGVYSRARCSLLTWKRGAS